MTHTDEKLAIKTRLFSLTDLVRASNREPALVAAIARYACAQN